MRWLVLALAIGLAIPSVAAEDPSDEPGSGEAAAQPQANDPLPVWLDTAGPESDAVCIHSGVNLAPYGWHGTLSCQSLPVPCIGIICPGAEEPATQGAGGSAEEAAPAPPPDYDPMPVWYDTAGPESDSVCVHSGVSAAPYGWYGTLGCQALPVPCIGIICPELPG